MGIQKGACSWQPGVTLLLAVCFFCKSVASLSDPVETAALQTFRQHLQDPSGSLSTWTGNDPCGGGWKWVYCEAKSPANVSKITELRLFDLNLTGSLVPELGNLSYLLYLNVMWNNLNGSIPSTLGNLKNLLMLLLNGNNFSGFLPQELGQLTNLNRIQIDQNNFTGPIPYTFGNLTNVMHLHMNNNSLTGSLPPQLGKLQEVIHLLLDNNKLSGNLSADIAKAPNLRIIQLDNNQLNGSIPPAWGQIPTLLKLSLKNCGLQGNISISRLTSLQVLDLSDNNLAGTLPDITYPVNLTSIDISNNRLSGQFPMGIGNLQQLQALLLENNNITGSLPSNLGNATNFQTQPMTLLDLQNNSITSINNTSLVRLASRTGTRVWLSGNNLICGGASAQINPICVPQVDNSLTMTDIPTSSNSTNGCSCTLPFVGVSSSNNTQCRCVQPITVRFRLKSPSFQYFDRYQQSFLSWLSNGLNMSSTDTNINNAYWTGSRLTMTLLLLPATSNTFNASEFTRLYNAFSQWQINDSPVFGPYELLSFEPRVPPGSLTGSTQNGLVKGAIAGIVLGVAALTAIIVGAIMLCILPRHRVVIARTRKGSLRQEISDAALKVTGVKAFTFEELAEITNQFDAKNQVGEGGYGKVYKGKLRDGQWVAIKRAEVGSLQGAREFYTEIELLSRVHHRNLVMLVGYCNDEDEQMLVYEYMSGGTLRDHLIETSSEPLDFPTRLSIALGSARGILYLHTEANPPIFHRDIKASNILLDEKKTAKVADFGLSKLAPVPDLEGATPNHISTVVKGTPVKVNQSTGTEGSWQGLTRILSTLSRRHSHMPGKKGYLDPEYFLTHQLTDKSDVYSFGVVLLEFVTGRQPISMGKNIVREVSASYQKGLVLDCVDERMGPFIAEAMEQLLQLALACVRDVPDERPNMGEVVRELESIWRSTPYSLHSGNSVDLGYIRSMHKPASFGFVSPASSMDIEKSDLTELMSRTITRIPPR